MANVCHINLVNLQKNAVVFPACGESHLTLDRKKLQAVVNFELFLFLRPTRLRLTQFD